MTRTATKPTPLLEWMRANQPAEQLFARDGFLKQIGFLLEDLPEIFHRCDPIYRTNYRTVLEKSLTVVGSHVSKSVRLPVVCLQLKDGTTITMRCNFHDWKVSVNSPYDIDRDFLGLFDPAEQVDRFCCEGFTKKQIYGPYAKNKRQFTIQLLPSHHHLFAFLWLLAHRPKAKR